MPTRSFDTTIVITKKSVQSLIDIFENENVPHVDLKILTSERGNEMKDTTDCATPVGAISGMVCHPNDMVWYSTHDVECKAMPDGTIVTFCRRCGVIIQVQRPDLTFNF